MILSRYGGELKPKDRLYSNALHAYDENLLDLLNKHDVPICGELEWSFKPENATWISVEGNEHGRYEKGFKLLPVGKNLSFKTTPYIEQLKSIRDSIEQEHDLRVPPSVLFNYLKVDIVVYSFPQFGDWIQDSLICADKSESVDSIIESMGQSQSEIFQYKPIGEIRRVPISLFEETERYAYNSLRKKHETESAIILPSMSKYNHFWTEKVD